MLGVVIAGVWSTANARHEAALGSLAWVVNWDDVGTQAGLNEYADRFSHLAFFWFYLGHEDGRIFTYKDVTDADRELLDQVRGSGIVPLAVVSNLDDSAANGVVDKEPWAPQRVEFVIQDEGRRQAHITELLKLVENGGFGGIQIDYEQLSGWVRDDFTSFIAELAQVLHQKDKILSVAIHPKRWDGDPQAATGAAAQDWVALHPHVDQFVLMTYGQHYHGSMPGPLATPKWVESILYNATHLSGVPASKIFMGMSGYAEIWRRPDKDTEYRGKPNEDAPISYVLDKEQTYGKRSRRPDGTPYLNFTDESGVEHYVAFEDQQSWVVKQHLANKFGVNKIALWRLGAGQRTLLELQ